MPLIAPPTATVSIGANATSGTITGDMSAHNVLPGMELFIGSRNGRNGNGRVLASYTANGSTGASFAFNEAISASAITNQPFVIDNFAAPTSVAAQNNLSLTLLVNALRKFFGLSVSLDQASKTLPRDRGAGAGTFFQDLWQLAGRTWFGLEHRTVSSGERLLLRTYTDGTTASESIDIDGATGGVKMLAAEGTIASAATCDISTPRTGRVLISGTTTITSFGSAKRQEIWCRLGGALTLQHNATWLALPRGADIQGVAGDVFFAVSDGSGNWRVLFYIPISGKALVAPAATEITGTSAVGRALMAAKSAGLARSVLSARQGRANRPLSSYVASAPWTAQESPAANQWRSVCWSAELGLFCAVADTGTGNRVMTSPDGTTWTARTSAADNGWWSVCWSAELGLFVAVAITGTGNRVMTSPDGVTWTARASAADNQWRSVCWSAELGLFVAVADDGAGNQVMTSPDGITWTLRTSAASNSWRSVCWSAELGLFCAVATTGTGNRVMTSPDGVTWTTRASAADNQWISVCWSAELGLFCAVAITGTGNQVMTSRNGIAWTTRASAADNQWISVCWSAELGLFCAVAITGVGNRVMTSPDGITWTARTSAANSNWYFVCWSAELGLFCAVAMTGTSSLVMTSSSAHLYWPGHPSLASSLAAAGTTQATARALTSAVSIVTTVASGSGVVLAPPDVGSRQEVLNRGANALLVYPPAGAQIEGGAANAAVSLPVGGRAIFLCASATQFCQM